MKQTILQWLHSLLYRFLPFNDKALNAILGGECFIKTGKLYTVNAPTKYAANLAFYDIIKDLATSNQMNRKHLIGEYGIGFLDINGGYADDEYQILTHANVTHAMLDVPKSALRSFRQVIEAAEKLILSMKDMPLRALFITEVNGWGIFFDETEAEVSAMLRKLARDHNIAVFAQACVSNEEHGSMEAMDSWHLLRLHREGYIFDTDNHGRIIECSKAAA